jgi:hypothetical protein
MTRTGSPSLGRARLAVLTVATAIAAAPAALGGIAPSSVRVTVKPSSGVGHTRFALSFRAPDQTGTTRAGIRHYQLSAGGRSGTRCGSSVSAIVPDSRKGQRVRVTLAPPGPFRVWCKGRYAGTLEESYRPVCPEGKLCPMYVAMSVVGRFAFRVR